jgi:SAM-dependent methyltransferase
MAVNIYTRAWFELFLETRPFTQQETEFVIRNLPNPPYQSILDICCGQGRHTNLLAQEGYTLVGLDLDRTALAIAQGEAAGSVKYVCHDMRNLGSINESFDAIILLWQSFGYFDELTNETILSAISQKLNKHGRFLLDIYNRAYWESNQGHKQFERKGIQIDATNTMTGNQLTSHLVYDAGKLSESFEWQLYYLEEIVDLAAKYSLKCLLSCVESDESKPVSKEKSQMQIVFEKR